MDLWISISMLFHTVYIWTMHVWFVSHVSRNATLVTCVWWCECSIFLSRAHSLSVLLLRKRKKKIWIKFMFRHLKVNNKSVCLCNGIETFTKFHFDGNMLLTQVSARCLKCFVKYNTFSYCSATSVNTFQLPNHKWDLITVINRIQTQQTMYIQQEIQVKQLCWITSHLHTVHTYPAQYNMQNIVSFLTKKYILMCLNN